MQYQFKKKDVGSLYINSLINIGITFKNQRKFQEAVSVYEKVNLLNGQEQSGLFNHATCLIGLIESTPSADIVNRDRAMKVNRLLDAVQKMNSENKMVVLQRIKLDFLLQRTKSKAESTIAKLKEMLKD